MFRELFNKTPHTRDTVNALWRLEKIILDTLDFKTVVQRTVDSILTELNSMKLGYRIIVLVLVDKQSNTLKRIAISQTPEAQKVLAASPIPFNKIDIPLSANDNLVVKVVNTKKPLATTYWPDILHPSFTNEEAIEIQSLGGIITSLVYPVISRKETIGAMIFSLSKPENKVSDQEKDLIAGFTDIVGLAVQNAELYTSVEENAQKLKKSNEDLKQLDKLKDEFVSLASHELRTPMTVIKSYLWMTLAGKGGQLSEKQNFYLSRALTSTERLITFVNEMLNVSRIESNRIMMQLRPINLDTLTKEIVSEIEPRADELKLSISISPHTLLPPIMADPDKLREVFTNLLGNSMKFTPSGGHIIISFEKKDGFIETAITDTGIGIMEEDLPKLFHKFGMVGENYLTKTSSQSTGLGLYIAKSIVELHGGKIWVSSKGIAKGTTFSFTIPIAKTKEEDLPPYKITQPPQVITTAR